MVHWRIEASSGVMRTVKVLPEALTWVVSGFCASCDGTTGVIHRGEDLGDFVLAWALLIVASLRAATGTRGSKTLSWICSAKRHLCTGCCLGTAALLLWPVAMNHPLCGFGICCSCHGRGGGSFCCRRALRVLATRVSCRPFWDCCEGPLAVSPSRHRPGLKGFCAIVHGVLCIFFAQAGGDMCRLRSQPRSFGS